MCQAIAEGGRRCPRHRRDSIVAMHIAATESGLTADAVNDLFTELRREGRHVNMDDMEASYEQLISTLEAQAEGEGVPPRYRRILAERVEDDAPAPDTVYALTRLRRQAITRALSLAEAQDAIADRVGATRQEVAEHYETAASGLGKGQAANSPSYTSEAHTEAYQGSLPTDPSSVVALEMTKEHFAPPAESRARFAEDAEGLALSSSGRTTAFYDGDGGVLHLHQDGTIARYRNVPREFWQNLSQTPRGARIAYFRAKVQGNSAYQYSDATEAMEDSLVYRCEACGQFRALSHVCPEKHAIRAILAHSPDRARESITQGEVAEYLQEQKEPTEADSPEIAFQRGVTPLPSDSPTMDEEAEYRIAPETYRALLSARIFELRHVRAEVIQNALRSATARLIPGSMTEEELYALPGNHFLYFGGRRSSVDRELHSFIGGAYNPRTHSPAEGDAPISISYDVAEQGVTLEYSRRGRLSELPGYEDDEEAVEARLEALRQYRADNEDDLLEGDMSAQFTRDIHFREGVTSKVLWATTASVREARDRGKIIHAPVIWGEPENDTVPVTIDELGYEIKNVEFVVTGELGMRRDENGAYKVVSPRQALRCNCRVYAHNYHCTHIDYVYNHAPKMGQQVENGTQVSAPSGEVLDDQHVVSVAPTASNRARTVQARLPSRVWENVTDVPTLGRMRSLADTQFLLPQNSQISAAFQSANVVSASFQTSGMSDRTLGERRITMSGEMVYTRDEHGDITQSVREVECSCVRYRESYQRGDDPATCPHVAIFRDHHRDILPASNDTTGQGMDTHWEDQNEVENQLNRTNYFSNLEVYRLMELEGKSEAEAYDIVTKEREKEAREDLERERRWVEREREHRASRAALVQEQHDRLMADNPGFAVYRAAQARLWENADERYGDNTEAVKALITETQTQKGTRANILGYRTENVTDGVCDPSIPGSRRFGVELEFVLPSDQDKHAKLAEIAAELHSVGLSDRDHLGGYHSGKNSGWSSWNLEEDTTVDGELVSPLMADTPEHWEQLSKALAILKKHGASTSTKAGSHVHVSSGSYGGKLAKSVEVLRTMKENEDVLYRAGSDPATGSHRGITWCEPNVSTSSFGDIQGNEFDTDGANKYDARVALSEHMEHQYAINFEGSYGADPKAHIEYRLWDASLDAATIQRQVMASVAITESAEREVDAQGGVSHERDEITQGRTKGYGASGRRLGKGTTEVDDIAARNVASFVDRVFRRKEDREDFIRLFAINRNT